MFRYTGNWAGFEFDNQFGKWLVVSMDGFFSPPRWTCKLVVATEAGNHFYSPDFTSLTREETLLLAWATQAQAHIDELEETTKLAGKWIQGAEVSVEPGYSGSRAEMLARLDTVLGNQSAAQEATNEQ